MIKTVNLTKKYKDVVAVDGLNLEIKKGELFSLLGVNGAGKTTTVKMLATLSKPTDGNAYVGGFDVDKDVYEVKKIISISPQETAIASNLTVKENLEFICGIYGIDKNTTAQKISTISDELNLDEVLNKKASKLSGGYKRRLSIAMALICEPKVLFLDEPTLGLDVISRSELWSYIKKMKDRLTIVLTTHYMEEAEKLSDRVGIMQKGKLIAVGSPEEIKAQAGVDNFEDAFVKLVKGE